MLLLSTQIRAKLGGDKAGTVTVTATSTDDESKFVSFDIVVEEAAATVTKLYPGSVSRSSNAVLNMSNDLISVTSALNFAGNTSGKNGETANNNVAGKNLTDDDKNKFTNVGVTSDSCKAATKEVFTITATKKVKITVYLNGCDSKYGNAKAATVTHSLDNNYSLTVGNSLDVVHKLEVTINEGDSCVISMTTASGITGYLAVFAIYAQAV